jgi:hypothetical protein
VPSRKRPAKRTEIGRAENDLGEHQETGTGPELSSRGLMGDDDPRGAKMLGD